MKKFNTILIIAILIELYIIAVPNTITIIGNHAGENEIFTQEVFDVETIKKSFWVSAYNTVKWQTDDSPCIAASGKNICGRKDVIACPIKYPFGTQIQILDKIYTCEDRMKHDGSIDISFDKDVVGAKKWGIKYLEVQILIY